MEITIGEERFIKKCQCLFSVLISREAQVVPQAPTAVTIEPVLAPVTYLAPATATPTQPTAPAEEIYPQALIQVCQGYSG